MEDLTFDDETLYETEKRLDQINGLKAKYGRTMRKSWNIRIHSSKKLEKVARYEENFLKPGKI